MNETFYLIYRMDFATNKEYFHSIYKSYDCALIAEKLLMKQDLNSNYKIEQVSWDDIFEYTEFIEIDEIKHPFNHGVKHEF